jgi:hypothetical protein
MTRRQLVLDQALLTKLGAVQIVSFAGVGPAQRRHLPDTFDKGSAEWRIDLTKDGKIRRIALGPE